LEIIQDTNARKVFVSDAQSRDMKAVNAKKNRKKNVIGVKR
jgi:hypothetical protein